MTTKLSPEEITQQQELLLAYRRTLAHLLQQAANYGGVSFAPPQTANGIAAARSEIQRIKAILRENGIIVDDDPNDDAPAQPELTSPRTTDTQVNTGGGDYAEGNIDKRQRGAFVEDSTIQGDVIGGDKVAGDKVLGDKVDHHHYYQPAITPLDRQQQRNRRAMLAKVKAIWIDGLLKQSLAEVVKIDLGLVDTPDAVDLPLNLQYQELNRQPRPIPHGTPIIDVFTHMGGAMLILGAPGAGKTTLLLELARDLVARAEEDESHPIPVVFNLSSWAAKRRPLKEWLVEELNTKYDVPREVGQAWAADNALLPLLDGLDEVAEEHRSRCAETINVYRQEHGLVPLTVCSRVADYEALTTKLRLQQAVLVQPLTRQQIDTYLASADEQLSPLRGMLAEDSALRELTETPLMLTIMTLAYHDMGLGPIAGGGRDQYSSYLFSAYVSRMFARRDIITYAAPNHTIFWLAWLAHMLKQQKQMLFFIEQLQPGWLSTPVQRLSYAIGEGVSWGVAAGLVGGLMNALIVVVNVLL